MICGVLIEYINGVVPQSWDPEASGITDIFIALTERTAVKITIYKNPWKFAVYSSKWYDARNDALFLYGKAEGKNRFSEMKTSKAFITGFRDLQYPFCFAYFNIEPQITSYKTWGNTPQCKAGPRLRKFHHSYVYQTVISWQPWQLHPSFSFLRLIENVSSRSKLHNNRNNYQYEYFTIPAKNIFL